MPNSKVLDISQPYVDSSESESERVVKKPSKKRNKKKELNFKESVIGDLEEMGTKTKRIKRNVSLTQAMAVGNLHELESQGTKIAATSDQYTNIEHQADEDEAVVHGSTSCLGGCMHALIPRCFKSKSHHKEKHDKNLSKRKERKAQASGVAASNDDDIFSGARPIVYQYAGKRQTQFRFDQINNDLDTVDEGVERLKEIASDTSSELKFQRSMVDSIAKKSEKTEKHQKKSKKHMRKLKLNG